MQSRSLKQTFFHSSCKRKGNWLQTGLSYLTMPLNWTTEVVHQCLHRHVCLLRCNPFSLSLYVSLPVTIWVFLVYLVPVLFWWIHPGVSRFTFHFLSLSVFQLFGLPLLPCSPGFWFVRSKFITSVIITPWWSIALPPHRRKDDYGFSFRFILTGSCKRQLPGLWSYMVNRLNVSAFSSQLLNSFTYKRGEICKSSNSNFGHLVN